ncbi:HAD family hydrolase [Rhodoplanes elegans]|nr:HAD-IA family hydrolase [Rhodoplanes elegans]
MRYEAVVFDCFGVLCPDVGHQWLAQTFPEAEAAEIVRTLFVAADHGRISQETLFAELGKRSHRPPALVELDWIGLLTIHADVVALVQRLRPSRKLGLLTNAPSAFVREMLRNHKLEKLFDSIVVSSEIGHAKPDAQAFRAILAALCAEPHQAVMIDDNPRNVAAAEGIGMDGLLFRSAGELELALFP